MTWIYVIGALVIFASGYGVRSRLKNGFPIKIKWDWSWNR